jgi:hypothetical protein
MSARELSYSIPRTSSATKTYFPLPRHILASVDAGSYNNDPLAPLTIPKYHTFGTQYDFIFLEFISVQTNDQFTGSNATIRGRELTHQQLPRYGDRKAPVLSAPPEVGSGLALMTMAHISLKPFAEAVRTAYIQGLL